MVIIYVRDHDPDYIKFSEICFYTHVLRVRAYYYATIKILYAGTISFSRGNEQSYYA